MNGLEVNIIEVYKINVEVLVIVDFVYLDI